MAHGTRLFPQIIRQSFLHLLRPRLFVAALGHGDDAFENPLVRLGLAFLVRVLESEELRAAVLKLHLGRLRQIVIGRVHGEAVGFEECIEHTIKPIVLIIWKWLDGPQSEGQAVVRQDAMEIGFQRGTETHAGGASAEGIVERENAGLRLGEGNPAVRAGEMGAEDRILAADDSGHHHPFAQLQRRFYGVRQAADDAFLHDDAIHHHFDGVLFIFLQLDVIGQRKHFPIHTDADIAFLPELFQKLLVGALLRCGHGS